MSLTRLLSLASPLLEKGDLSLQQLVPVHKSLCKAIGGDASTSCATVTSLDEAVDSLTSDSDTQVARRILKEGTQVQQLLLLQYLVGSVEDSLQALATLVLPFLLSHEQHNASEEFREALLDAVFFNTTTLHESSSSSSAWLKACLESCHGNWSVVCRVLKKLHHHAIAPELQIQTRDYIYTKVLEGIQVSLVSDDYLMVLHPIVTWLLPLLVEKGEEIMSQQEHIDKLWTCLLSNIKNGGPENPQAALVVSAILCSILPSIVTTTLPVVGNNNSTSTTITTRALAVHQTSLWNLILYSLQQGMDSTSLKYSGGRGQGMASMDQMLRRRGLYMLRLLLESCNDKNATLWSKYVLCFEALEMETELHLVDQVWDTVAEICVATASHLSNNGYSSLPTMTWEWISAMLARVLLSDVPALRKLGLYRFLSGHAGIGVSPNESNNTNVPDSTNSSASLFTPGQKKHPIKSKKRRKGTTATSAPIDLVSTDFVVQVIIPSYDTILQSVGTNMQFEENGRIQVQDVTPLLMSFLGAYVSALDMPRRHEFLHGLFSPPTVCDLRLKTTVIIYEAVASADVELPTDQVLLQTAVQSFGNLFHGTSVVAAYRDRLLAAFATMLSRSSKTDAVNPEILLKTLAFYPMSTTLRQTVTTTTNGSSNLLGDDPKYVSLQKWLSTLGKSASWASCVGAACASSFVMGQLFPPTSDWIPESGSSETERAMGGAIVLLCALAAAASEECNASEMLWPAIHKGLATVPQGHPWQNANRSCRSLILLENGCRLGVTSGIGNGDLVMDKSQQMMPPPPNIEELLSNAVDFDLLHMKALTSFEGVPFASKTGSLRSGNTARVSLTFAHLISQMQVFCSGFPSSLAVSSAADKMLKLSMEQLAMKDQTAIGVVQNTALAFGALTCGADPNGALYSVESCRFILKLEYLGNINSTVSNEKTARSVFQYAKWGTISHLLHALLETRDTNGDSESNRLSLLNDLFNVAEESVYATPPDALLPLFDCVVTAARSRLSVDNNGTSDGDALYTDSMAKIISALFAVKSEVKTGRPALYMLNEICALLFRPELLMDEYERILRQGDDTPTPIRDAFRRLMEMAGTKRSHISKIALSYITVAWLGCKAEDDAPSVSTGVGAIQYRKDICDLLLHKEVKMNESSGIQEPDVVMGSVDFPSMTDGTSVARGFVLTFLSRLPDVDDGLPTAALVELLHYIILYLLDNVCLDPNPGGAMIMLGTVQYSRKIRAWQALCVLSRFVTDTIADGVCDKVFECMGQNLYNQIRYFIEGFTIQCARRHPAIFGRKLVNEILRKDMSLQHVSSLMIVSGNLIVGRYKDDFFRQFDKEVENVVNLKMILAGVIPWLSSTQGFSRAISQLLVHKLIPLVLDIDNSVEAGLEDSDWFLRSIYRFLEENPEMKRLRKKQSKFFDRYDADEMCSAETLLELEVDEGSEANPEHMVDAIKKCLEQVYIEAHEHSAPEWKQLADIMERDKSTSVHEAPIGDDELVNFQRKIIPLDSLELDLGASRDASLKNALGRKKQQLLVCASLVDKVPNLAGLARTSEIFAAKRLIIPDTSVCQMDNFKSVSVGAGEWIEIEGCKEDVSVICIRATLVEATRFAFLPDDYCHIKPRSVLSTF